MRSLGAVGRSEVPTGGELHLRTGAGSLSLLQLPTGGDGVVGRAQGGGELQAEAVGKGRLCVRACVRTPVSEKRGALCCVSQGSAMAEPSAS